MRKLRFLLCSRYHNADQAISRSLDYRRALAENAAALAPFDLDNLKHQLPLVFPPDPDLPPSPKLRYRSAYRYLGFGDLRQESLLHTFSSFETAIRLFAYTHLEPLLAAHIYAPSAKGRTPYHPVSRYLLSLYRTTSPISRPAFLGSRSEP